MSLHTRQLFPDHEAAFYILTRAFVTSVQVFYVYDAFVSFQEIGRRELAQHILHVKF